MPYPLIMILSILLIPSINCYSSLRPKSFFHWKTNGSDDQEVSGSTAYWIGSATKQLSTGCCLSTAIPSLKRYYVTVGAEGNLAFNPMEIDANIGDVVIFTFLALNHTLTQSSLVEPCTNRGGFNTGFNQFNPENKFGDFVVEYRVDTQYPQWFFCAQTSQTSHCRAGMVFALNARGRMNSFVSAAIRTGTSRSSNLIITTGKTVLKTAFSASSPTTQHPTSSVITKDHSTTIAIPTSQSSPSAPSLNQSTSSVRVSQAAGSLEVSAKQVLTRALAQVWLLVILFIIL